MSFDFSPEELQWQLNKKTCSVTGLAVGIDSSTVGEVAKSLEGAGGDRVAGLA
jgi:hypothetical protein